MQIRSFLKGVVPFGITLLLGVAAAWFLMGTNVPDSNSVVVKEAPPAAPVGSAMDGPGPGKGDEVKSLCPGTCNVKILSKPRANYTDEARQHNTQGNVELRLTFLASGQIGSITPISGLPYGLTEQAIAAARGIKFTPATKDGTPYTKQMTVQYGFTIY
jgi:TonB family protein